MWRPRAWIIGGIRCGGVASGSRQLLAAVAALLGVTGQPESNRGRNFRGPGVVVIVLDACVAADAVASLPTFVDSGSDVGATSAPPSSCMDGRSCRWFYVIPESKALQVRLWQRCESLRRLKGCAGGCGGAVVESCFVGGQSVLYEVA